MILEAKYVGPFSVVTVPGFNRKTVKRGEPVKVRVPDGASLGGCWDVTKGAKEYEAALEEAEAKRKAAAEASLARKKEMREKIEASREERNRKMIEELTARGERDATKSASSKVEKPKPAKGED